MSEVLKLFFKEAKENPAFPGGARIERAALNELDDLPYCDPKRFAFRAIFRYKDGPADHRWHRSCRSNDAPEGTSSVSWSCGTSLSFKEAIAWLKGNEKMSNDYATYRVRVRIKGNSNFTLYVVPVLKSKPRNEEEERQNVSSAAKGWFETDHKAQQETLEVEVEEAK